MPRSPGPPGTVVAARVLMILIGVVALACGAVVVVTTLTMLASVSALGASGGRSPGLAGSLLTGLGAVVVAPSALALAVGGYWIWAGVAVGRASRFARALSTVFLAIVTVAVLAIAVLVPVLSASGSDSTSDALGGVSTLITLGVLTVSVAVLVLLWGPASTRAFFARPLPCTVCEEPAEPSAQFCGQCGHELAPRVPGAVVAVQVLLALNAICEVGMVVVGAGGAMLLGAIGPSVVASGIGDDAAVGALGTASAVFAVLAISAAVSVAVDLWAIPRVASGRPVARVVVSVWFVLDPLVTLVALAAQGASAAELVPILVFGGLLPATLLVLLWAPPSSARHFAPSSPAARPAAVSIPDPRQQPSRGQDPRAVTVSSPIPGPRPATRPGPQPADDPLTTPVRLGAPDTRLGPPSGRHARPDVPTGRHAVPAGPRPR